MMHYIAVDVDRARRFGFDTTNYIEAGGKVILCENDMKLVNADIQQAAAALEGTIMTAGETQAWLREQLNT